MKMIICGAIFPGDSNTAGQFEGWIQRGCDLVPRVLYSVKAPASYLDAIWYPLPLNHLTPRIPEEKEEPGFVLQSSDDALRPPQKISAGKAP